MQNNIDENPSLPVQTNPTRDEDYFLVRDIFSTLVEKREAEASKELRFGLYKELGNYHTRMGEWDCAADCYDKALVIEPASDVIYVNLGTLEIQRNQRDAAKERFRRAIELNPANPRALCGLGILALADEDLDGAMSFFLATLDLDYQNTVAIQQLLALSDHQGDFTAVKARLVTCIQKDAANDELYFLLAGVCFKESDWESCVTLLDKTLELQPSHERARELRTEVEKRRI
jgi:tetratricopeptide (TPR) repeat protein